MQNLENIILLQKPYPVDISKRCFLFALATLPISLLPGESISLSFASSLWSQKSNTAPVGLQLLAEFLITNFPKQYAKLKAQIESDFDLSDFLTRNLHISPQKIAKEFANHEYMVIDGCMFSKSELQLSILLFESQNIYSDLSGCVYIR